MTSKFDGGGLSTTNAISQFDIKTETGVTNLEAGMKVIGLTALWAFLETKRRRPLLYADLKRALESAEFGTMTDFCAREEDEMGHATLSPSELKTRLKCCFIGS